MFLDEQSIETQRGTHTGSLLQRRPSYESEWYMRICAVRPAEDCITTAMSLASLRRDYQQYEVQSEECHMVLQ